MLYYENVLWQAGSAFLMENYVMMENYVKKGM